jgi:hypothetical protein
MACSGRVLEARGALAAARAEPAHAAAQTAPLRSPRLPTPQASWATTPSRRPTRRSLSSTSTTRSASPPAAATRWTATRCGRGRRCAGGTPRTQAGAGHTSQCEHPPPTPALWHPHAVRGACHWRGHVLGPQPRRPGEVAAAAEGGTTTDPRLHRCFIPGMRPRPAASSLTPFPSYARPPSCSPPSPARRQSPHGRRRPQGAQRRPRRLQRRRRVRRQHPHLLPVGLRPRALRRQQRRWAPGARHRPGARVAGLQVTGVRPRASSYTQAWPPLLLPCLLPPPCHPHHSLPAGRRHDHRPAPPRDAGGRRVAACRVGGSGQPVHLLRAAVWWRQVHWRWALQRQWCRGGGARAACGGRLASGCARAAHFTPSPLSARQPRPLRSQQQRPARQRRDLDPRNARRRRRCWHHRRRGGRRRRWPRVRAAPRRQGLLLGPLHVRPG